MVLSMVHITRYLLTSTSSSTDFSLKVSNFDGGARISSDLFSLAASQYGRSWSSSMVDTEQLLTQHQSAARMRQAGALSNALASV